MDSIDPACNSLKHTYDACFIRWVEGYLEPLTGDASPLPPPAKLSSSAGSSSSSTPPRPDPSIRAKEKAEEYERLCGESWRGYKECVWKGVRRKGLADLIESAREENPLVSIDSPVGGGGVGSPKK